MSNNIQDNNIPTNLVITLEEAAMGKIESLHISQREMCEDCAGTGNSWRSEDGICASCGSKGWHELDKVLEVPIPAGIETGAPLCIPGEGKLDPTSQLRRDLKLTIKVSEHELFERRRNHLYTTVSVPQDQITSGTEVIVPTLLDGRKQLRVPPGTSTGAVFRLAGLGMRSIESIERGDLFVKLQVSERDNTYHAAAAPSANTSTVQSDRGTRQQSSLKRIKVVIGTIIILAIASIIGFIYLSIHQSETHNQNVNSQPSSVTVQSPQTIIYPPAPAPTPSIRTPLSLPNGSDITPAQGPRGNNTLTIINDGYYDVAVKIVNSATQKTRRFVYVRANSTAVTKNVAREVCVLRIMSGTDWDVNARKFLSGLSFYEFDKPFDFKRVRYTVRLQPTLGGTLRDIPINEEDFKDK